MKHSTLMVQGCTSDAGKSMLVTALCRWLKRSGQNVAPFKSQNMALNSAVTADGGEIGRAQAVQAQACKIAPHVDMNPILLKPNTDIGAQVIVHGHALKNMDAADYHDYKRVALTAVLESYARLSEQYECVIVEGAGSPAEINLRKNDIANMGFAEEVDCPIIIIADIDRGGVFAHLVGTLALLSESEQARVKGFVINKFRGDISLLQSGLDWLEEYTKKPVIGVLPYIHGLHLESEDALSTDSSFDAATKPENQLRIVIPILPHMSNHTDFDPLRLHPQVQVQFVAMNEPVPPADLIILPGSKNVIFDLQFLRDQGWEKVLQRHLRFGGKLIGICGGFQMLGKSIHDPDAVEGKQADIVGLGLLDFTTRLSPQKQLRNVSGSLQLNKNISPLHGYEIHAGVSIGPDLERHVCVLENGNDGARSADGDIWGSYVHGLFESMDACSAILSWAGIKNVAPIDYDHIREQEIERLADSVEEHLDTDLLQKILHLDKEQSA